MQARGIGHVGHMLEGGAKWGDAHLRSEGESVEGQTDRCREAAHRFSVFTFDGPSLQLRNSENGEKRRRKRNPKIEVIIYIIKKKYHVV